jgi:hypothetical protein
MPERDMETCPLAHTSASAVAEIHMKLAARKITARGVYATLRSAKERKNPNISLVAATFERAIS